MSASREEVSRLYDELLVPRLAALETLRLDVRRYIVKAAAIVALPFALFFFGDWLEFLVGPTGASLLSGAGFALIFVAVVVVAFVYVIPGATAFFNYQQRFKREVVSEIFKIVCPAATYEPTAGIPASIFDEPGLFNTLGGFSADDLVRGRIGQTPFEASEVKRSYTSGSGKNKRTVVVFHGLFFHIDFNKAVRGTTIVQPTSAPGHQTGARLELTRVTMEDPGFEKEFATFATDEVEARYILTPAMMERLLELRSLAGSPVFMAFKGNRLYLGVHTGRQLFEPGIASTTSKEAIERMALEFGLAETIVQELDLNTRIWSKDVDESLLQRAVAPSKGLGDVLARAQTGSLTAQALWDAANAEEEGADKPAPRPDGSAIRIDRSAGVTSFHYGDNATLVFSILLSLLSIPIAVAAVRAAASAWAAQIGPGWTLERAGALPAVPIVDGWVTSLPLAWLAGSIVIGGFAALDWTMRVRQVDVAPGEILVRRGLRPWPRRYARPPYNGVSNLGRSVCLKSDGFSLRMPTVSPMLSDAEAMWVAWEMRRALRERR